MIEITIIGDLAGADNHVMTARKMFGDPIEGMPPDVQRRAKAINFCIIYGISAFGLANQLGISRTSPKLVTSGDLQLVTFLIEFGVFEHVSGGGEKNNEPF